MNFFDINNFNCQNFVISSIEKIKNELPKKFKEIKDLLSNDIGLYEFLNTH